MQVNSHSRQFSGLTKGMGHYGSECPASNVDEFILISFLLTDNVSRDSFAAR